MVMQKSFMSKALYYYPRKTFLGQEVACVVVIVYRLVWVVDGCKRANKPPFLLWNLTCKSSQQQCTTQNVKDPPAFSLSKVMEEFYHPRTVWVPLGILLGSGTLFAVLTLQWQCCFVTFSTATFGSAIITVTVDYFIELFALVHYVYERLRVGSPVCLSVSK